jgi:hypothetical protein
MEDFFIMSLCRKILGISIIGLSSAATLAIAQAPSQDVISKLDDNQSILVDKQTFDVIKGNAKTDNPLATLAKMGAREVSAGAIVFRHGDKLYIGTARRRHTLRLRPRKPSGATGTPTT